MIRLAVASDAGDIDSIIQRAYAIYVPRMGAKPAPMLENYRARISAGDVWVHESAEGIVQGVLGLKETDGMLLLENVAVGPEAQRKGIGRALITFAEAEASRRGFSELHLYTNEQMTENMSLYESLGFTITGRKIESGYRRVYMKKQTSQ